MNPVHIGDGVEITLPDALQAFGLVGKRVTFTHHPPTTTNILTYKHIFKYHEVPNLEIVIPELIRIGNRSDSKILYMFTAERGNKGLWLTIRGLALKEKDPVTGNWEHKMGTDFADLTSEDLKQVIDACVNCQLEARVPLVMTIVMHIYLDNIHEPEASNVSSKWW